MKLSRLAITTVAALLFPAAVSAQAPQPGQPTDRPIPVPRAGEEQRTPPATQPGQPQPTTGVNTNTNRVAQALRNVFVPLKWEDLPAAVQNTVKEQGGTQKIADIDREDRRGQTVYEIEFEREGKNMEIHVAADGKLVPSEYEAVPSRGAEGTRTEGATEAKPRSLEGAVYIGPKFQDLPAAVQNTVGQHAKSDQIADIDVERRTGRVVYEVEFETAGRNAEIHVAEDGTLLPQPTGLTEPLPTRPVPTQELPR